MHLDTQGLPLSQIIANAHVEEAMERAQTLLKPYNHHLFFYEDFLVEHAKEVVKAAYIAESDVKYLILAGFMFRREVQNALLKILEEPPRNIRFIIIVPSKNILLPTVLSRLLFTHEKGKKESTIKIPFNFSRFTLEEMYRFVQEHQHVGKQEMLHLLEDLFIKASKELGRLTVTQCDVFNDAYKLVTLNAKAQTLLTMLLLHFVE